MGTHNIGEGYKACIYPKLYVRMGAGTGTGTTVPNLPRSHTYI